MNLTLSYKICEGECYVLNWVGHVILFPQH